MRCVCLTLALLFALFMVTATACYFWVHQQVARFTVAGTEDDIQPFDVPARIPPTVEMELKLDEAKLFWDQLRAGVEPEHDFEISQEDLNGLIAMSDYLRGHAQVQIIEGQWRVDLALPTDQLPGGKGRYFIGAATVDTVESERETNIRVEITPKHDVPNLDFATLLKGKLIAMNHMQQIVKLEYGQFLNWVVPDDWIAEHDNLLTCDCMDDEHHHHHHHHPHNKHQHHHHHHHEDERKKHCQEIMSALSRLERISLRDEKIVFTPVRALTGGKAGHESETVDEQVAQHVVDSRGEGVRGRRLSEQMMPRALVSRLLRHLF